VDSDKAISESHRIRAWGLHPLEAGLAGHFLCQRMVDPHDNVFRGFDVCRDIWRLDGGYLYYKILPFAT